MKILSTEQITSIQKTLAMARVGSATLSQLAAAHDLATGANLNGCLGELRSHIRFMVAAPPMRAEAKSMLLGIVTGIFTHMILRKTDRNHKET